MRVIDIEPGVEPEMIAGLAVVQTTSELPITPSPTMG